MSPCSIQVLVHHPDDSPAAGELVTLTVQNYQNNYKVEKNYTSDVKGEINFSLPAVDDKFKDYSINVSFSMLLQLGKFSVFETRWTNPIGKWEMSNDKL